jgi:hypothetical protein
MYLYSVFDGPLFSCAYHAPDQQHYLTNYCNAVNAVVSKALFYTAIHSLVARGNAVLLVTTRSTFSRTATASTRSTTGLVAIPHLTAWGDSEAGQGSGYVIVSSFGP